MSACTCNGHAHTTFIGSTDCVTCGCTSQDLLGREEDVDGRDAGTGAAAPATAPPVHTASRASELAARIEGEVMASVLAGDEREPWDCAVDVIRDPEDRPLVLDELINGGVLVAANDTARRYANGELPYDQIGGALWKIGGAS